MKSTYSLKDNEALVNEVKSRREAGQDFKELAAGEARLAIEQLSIDDRNELERLTDPNK